MQLFVGKTNVNQTQLYWQGMCTHARNWTPFFLKNSRNRHTCSSTWQLWCVSRCWLNGMTQLCLGLITIKGRSKMCSFITQHNATDVASFEGACNWHAGCRNVHQIWACELHVHFTTISRLQCRFQEYGSTSNHRPCVATQPTTSTSSIVTCNIVLRKTNISWYILYHPCFKLY